MSTTENTTINPADLTDEQLEQLLAERQKAKAKAKQAAKKKYEHDRHTMVSAMCGQAALLSEELASFKKYVFERLGEFHKEMLEYGDVKESNKNFTIKTDDGELIVSFSHHVTKGFDERAIAAEEKLRKFLESFIKKRDKDTYTLVESLLERNKAGDYDVTLINRLYKIEDKFDNDDWRDAIALFKEAYTESKTTNYVTFYHIDSNGKKQLINMNFSSI